MFFNGCFSDSRRISLGVPHGSCLGPHLFSVFINDLPYAVKKADVVMCADDVTLFCASSMLAELSENLQLELHTITNWVKMNKLVLNILKLNALYCYCCFVCGELMGIRMKNKVSELVL